MGSKFEHHILDEFLNPKIVDNFKNVDDMTINTGLEKFGMGEQQKIFGGQIGSTMLAGAARTQGARDIAGLKASQRLGSAALSRGGNNASSAGVNLLYDRMLKNEIGRVNDRTADQVVGGLPGYLNAAAGWGEAGNRGRMQKMAALSEATRLRQSNQTFIKKKSFWDKFKEGVGVASQIAGIAGSLFTGMPGGGSGSGGNPGGVPLYTQGFGGGEIGG